MATEWDQAVEMCDLFGPNWSTVQSGTSVSLVVDCDMHTGSMMVGTLVPDSRKVRIFGEIGSQVQGCRRLTLLDVVVDKVQDCVDLLH